MTDPIDELRERAARTLLRLKAFLYVADGLSEAHVADVARLEDTIMELRDAPYESASDLATLRALLASAEQLLDAIALDRQTRTAR